MVWIKRLFRKAGLWFFCKLGDPIFSPSLMFSDREATCLYCGKQHGKLTDKAALAYMMGEVVKLFNKSKLEVNDGA